MHSHTPPTAWRRSFRTRSLTTLGCLALSGPAWGADLTLDGASSIEVTYGTSFVAQVSGAPGSIAAIYYDVDPGPTTIAGVAVPLGLTPALGQLVLGSTDGAGVLATLGIVPDAPVLSGLQVHFAGLVLDAAEPLGLAVTPGALLTVVPPVGAGQDQATFVEAAVVLDGGDAADPDGLVPAGTTLLWELTSAPPGSGATIANADGLFGVLVPDLPGTYGARLRVSAGGVETVDETLVQAFRLDTTPALDGTWVAGPGLNVSGLVAGPVAGAGLTLDGNALALGPGGAFASQFVAFDPAAAFEPLLFELTTAGGQVARKRVTVGQGLALPLTAGAAGQLSAHLAPAGLQMVAQAGEQELLAADLDALLLGLPATQVANNEGLWGFTIFSATVKFTSVSFGQDIDLQLVPQSGSLLGLVKVKNVHATFDVWGDLLEIPYNLTGSIDSSSTDLSALMVLSVQNGEIVVDLQNPTVVRNGFNFDLDGFLGSVAELFIIEDWVKEQVESAVADSLSAEMGPAIEEILNSYELSGNLFETLEVDVQIDADFASVQQTSGGVTLRMNGAAAALSSEPGSPVVTVYPATFGSGPAFGALSPNGQVYTAGLAASAGFLNLVLCASTAAGLLDGDLAELVDPALLGGQPGEQLTVDALQVLFPGAGFDRFPVGTPVEMRAEGSLAPRVRATPGSANLGTIDLAGLVVEFRVAGADAPIPVLRLVLDASADLGLTIQADGTLSAALTGEQVTGLVVGSFPGGDLTVLQVGLDFLAGFLVPQLAAVLGQVPLPSLESAGLSLTPTEVSLGGPLQDHVGFYGDLELVPIEQQ
ncbi:hypothetical protein [Engelhardtia mirabilis]|uniref:Uncharacterized protein n=1 Tax=Engelhardtia mirabilis TaxID=2528011 RepID=A0A518BM96_9BACT|nr:hypothetical protein Pla133_31960 [Planctomycetes bacterium Pla133]QDV02428.1 hypothetical protein Pla86_31950 [Planctomycetes bacterium Pla86]